MITALQHFISKKGKFVFILLLLLVVVSFVLYLSQGSSVFDLMSDGGREKKEFFGYDWNDPDQRRFLNISTRAAGSVGVLASPVQDIVEKADNTYIQGLQQQIQAAFRANRDEVDQDAMQRMFQYMQAWPNFSRDFKVREIARSGAYDTEFLDQSIKTRVLLSGQANRWDLLDGSINHPSINSQFVKFLTGIDPSLESESNRTSALSIVGGRFGMTGSELESVLYSSFRDMLVDRIYTDRGFALSGEVDVLSQQNAFAWDGQVALLSKEDLPEYKLLWGEIRIKENPKKGDQIELSLGNKNFKFEFGKTKDDENASVFAVVLGDNPKKTGQNLMVAINGNDLGFQAFSRKNEEIILELRQEKLPKNAPRLRAKTNAVSFRDNLTPSLVKYFQENNNSEVFMEAPRTFATAMIFPTNKFLTSPTPADDARLRSYFERNRLDFLPDSESIKNGDKNETALSDVSFNDVAEEVREKVEAQDLADAKREAERLAQAAALDFLDNLNTFSDRIRKKYPDYISLRNSTELEDFLKDSGAEQRKISFTANDMNVQAMVLGLERRASEKRSNKEPLLEVQSLTNAKFFTRSVRKARNGYLVFLLDRKTEKQPTPYKAIAFSTLCKEYILSQKNSQFNRKIDEILEKLTSNSNATDSSLVTYNIMGKNQVTARASFDSRQRSIRAKITNLENAQSEIKNNQEATKPREDKMLSNLKDQLDQLTKERKAVIRLLQGAEALSVDNTWVEVERNEESAVFGLLSEVYSIRGKEVEDGQRSTMITNLELSRGMLARDEAISELVSLRLSE